MGGGKSQAEQTCKGVELPKVGKNRSLGTRVKRLGFPLTEHKGRRRKKKPKNYVDRREYAKNKGKRDKGDPGNVSARGAGGGGLAGARRKVRRARAR